MQVEYHQGGHELTLSMNIRFNAASLRVVLGNTSLMLNWLCLDRKLLAFLGDQNKQGMMVAGCSSLIRVTASMLAKLK